ncbi:50S ribosomal protein L3 chloroplastic, partial [Bienertia sinuspersici]
IIKLKFASPRAIQLNCSIGGFGDKNDGHRPGVGVMGTKLGMMSLFQDDGTVVPVTVIGLKEGNIVTYVKSESTDGYNAEQVGYEIKEFQLILVDGFTLSQMILFEGLSNGGDLVDIFGSTIGKGFQGG